MNEPQPQLTHAGGVVRTERDGSAVFLLVRASRAPYEWVLPKGHIEAGETPEQTAEREVLEEAGIGADVVAWLMDGHFVVRDKHLRVRYFLMRPRHEAPQTGERETRWCVAADAERLLAFDEAREALRLAASHA